jgi:NADH-quinone oxidoreductase subunit M
MLLSLTVLSPLLGATLVALLPREPVLGVRRTALVFALVPLLCSLLVLRAFQPGTGDFQLVERAAWIAPLGVSYHLGVDGVSLFLVLLTTVLTPIVVLAGFGDVRRHVKEYYVLFLVLETGMLGALLALDLFLFYVFWEVMLVPMYLLIGIWGGERRIYATIKFVLFTMAGSLLMLVAIVYLGWMVKRATGSWGFGYDAVLALAVSPREQLVLFAAFALAFAIKVPIFPLHTWLPDAHTEAPTGGSVILAGVLLKMGTYGFLRFAFPFFPDAVVATAPLFVALAVVGIVYGALVAVRQADMKKLVAYSSVSHLGFVVLGLFAFDTTAGSGAVYQMLNHGVSTGGLFLLVGMLYERRHTRALAEFGGLWAAVPRYAAALLVVLLASAGLPGLNGFVGEFLILAGTFERWPRAAAVATSGIVLGALYLLVMYQRVAFGPLDREENRTLADLDRRELAVIVPVIALCFAMGLHPMPLLSRIRPSVDRMLARIERAEAGQPAVARWEARR